MFHVDARNVRIHDSARHRKFSHEVSSFVRCPETTLDLISLQPREASHIDANQLRLIPDII